ncbi:pirin family protein [Nodosilinea sp. FACHB-13]|uniref:pirin family protein n=1 Tax=Leptolyngbya subtilissima TaxID=1346803 RepID=UPI0018EF56F7
MSDRSLECCQTETVSYVLDGRLEHKDSVGHAGLLNPSDVEWMTAGAGVVHSEMPEAEFTRTGGDCTAFNCGSTCRSGTR